MDWRIGNGLSVKSISAYRDLDALFIRDGDNTPFTYRETVNDDQQHQFSQELQLSGVSFGDRLNWLLGAYYFDEGATEHGKANLAIGTYAALQALQLQPGTTWCGLPGPNPRPIAACPTPLRFGGPGNPNNIGVDVGVDLFTRVANESTAFFGQGTYKLTDQAEHHRRVALDAGSQAPAADPSSCGERRLRGGCAGHAGYLPGRLVGGHAETRARVPGNT